ncbi:hypothetical protein LCGC14_1898440 [marine sediment metagenome]|uniref:Uncharacterized protein n=1 Tax=marine sediment metagenome TaxID=412755 RepID=A0A0F9IB67_9ZZZZ
MKKLMKALEFRKAKYLKRTGSPGHYKYVYKEAGAKTVAQISIERMRNKINASDPYSSDSTRMAEGMSDSEVKAYYKKNFVDIKTMKRGGKKESKTMKDAVAARGKKGTRQKELNLTSKEVKKLKANGISLKMASKAIRDMEIQGSHEDEEVTAKDIIEYYERKDEDPRDTLDKPGRSIV